ncbi:hypothetical protein [Paractinoplanes lichenicola]|uniref:Uncharacterized protein n=1 Tax=Paractinoplanes lichenicola TaxID=2802976 RepID=A0ABS1VTZ7_9ACTN|nr:hypothetical protein [Actinoplanes lichenicola]MBL7257954.1 hypothetical protein [Actinoplanes lichenicola]
MDSVVIATGRWLYDGTAPMTVRIVRLDYDFWYAVGEANGDLDPDESPRLNADGYLFYVRHRPGWSDESEHFWPDSQGFATLEEAIAAAESAVPTAVTWRRHDQG